MKSSLRIGGLLVLMLSYLLAYSIDTNAPFTPVFPGHTVVKSGEGAYLTPSTSGHYSDLWQVENPGKYFRNAPDRRLKKPVQSFATHTRTTEQYCFGVFTAYSGRWVNLPIRLQKVSLLFPYHHFW